MRLDMSLRRQLSVARALVATVAVLGACSGCASVPHLDAGTVLSKEHHDATLIMMPITSCNGGKYPICTTTYVPVQQPASWVLHLKNDRHEGVADVDEQTYEHCHEGDWYARR